MTNNEFELKFRAKVSEERKITNEILYLINEAEDRKIHLLRGYSSLFTWLVDMGYSESAAYRRIEAARQIRIVPEVAQKLESGELNLTTLTKARAAMRLHQRQTGQKMTRSEQSRVLQEVENKSSKETDRTLFRIFPDSVVVPKEQQTVISDELTRISINFDQEAMANLEWAKAFFSHSNPDGDTAETLARLIKEFRERHEKKSQNDTAAATKPCVNLSQARSLRMSLNQAKRKCEYRDPKTGRVCGSTYQVQSDHIRPRALGGADSLENRRCLCAAHNRLLSEQKLGVRWANSWR